MFFAKLHPLLVHFPMALLVAGALFELFGKWQKEEAIQDAGRFNVRWGLWSTLPVMIVGELGIVDLEVRAEAQPFLDSHIQFALVTFAIFGLLMFLQRFRRNSWIGFFHYLLLAIGLVLKPPLPFIMKGW